MKWGIVILILVLFLTSGCYYKLLPIKSMDIISDDWQMVIACWSGRGNLLVENNHFLDITLFSDMHGVEAHSRNMSFMNDDLIILALQGRIEIYSISRGEFIRTVELTPVEEMRRDQSYAAVKNANGDMYIVCNGVLFAYHFDSDHLERLISTRFDLGFIPSINSYRITYSEERQSLFMSGYKTLSLDSYDAQIYEICMLTYQPTPIVEGVHGYYDNATNKLYYLVYEDGGQLWSLDFTDYQKELIYTGQQINYFSVIDEGEFLLRESYGRPNVKGSYFWLFTYVNGRKGQRVNLVENGYVHLPFEFRKLDRHDDTYVSEDK